VFFGSGKYIYIHLYIYIFGVLFSFAVEKWLRLYHLVNVTMQKGSKNKTENPTEKSVNFTTHEAKAFVRFFPVLFFILFGGLFYSSSPVDKWNTEKIHIYVKICVINTA